MSVASPSGATSENVVSRVRELVPPPPDVAAFPALLERGFVLTSRAPVSKLWAMVSDTSRLNRALGLGEMSFVEVEGRLHGSNRSIGREQAWVEHPWSWVRERYLTSLRRYTKGWSVASYAAYVLEPTEDGSRLLVYFAIVPRGRFGRFLLGRGMSWLEERHREVLARLDREDAGARLHAPAPTPIAPEADAKLLALAEELGGRIEDPRAVRELVALVRDGDELDLDRIAPIARARLVGLDDELFVRTCLHATRLGILDMRWDVVCPRCRGVRESVTQLGEIQLESHCDVCDVDFDTGERHGIEITFRPHPSIRSVERRFYCSAEPATKDHIEVQVRLPVDGTIEIPTRLAPGRHRIRLHGDERTSLLDIRDTDAPTEVVPVVLEDGETAALVAPPAPTLRVASVGGDALLVVERTGWSDEALRPEVLLGMQGFRDLFSEQTLATGMRLEVGTQTIVFTDVVGSTAFYTVHGDPTAFGVVKSHFDTLYSLVERHRGAVVKTIGDATMTVFADPRDAVAVAEAIQDAFGHDDSPTALRLRIAMNTGPCIVVRFHQGLDYFGGTVNLAAKLQSLSSAGEIVMSRSTWESTGVADAVAARGGAVEDVVYRSDAFAGPMDAKRWTPAPR